MAVGPVSAAVLVVQVEAHRCGFPVEVVAELHRMVATVPLPGAPVAIEGVLDARGTAVPVLDLRTRLGLTPRPPLPSDHLVFVDVRERLMALRVDRVVDLVDVEVDHRVDLSDLASAPPHLSGLSRVDEDGLLVIHDAVAFLSDPEAAALDEALAALAASPGGGP